MTKRVLILAKTEHSRTPYDQWAAGIGSEIVILTGEKFYASYLPHVQETYIIENYDTNTDAIIKMAQKIHKEKPLDSVFCRAEVDVIRAAQIREQLGLPGQSVESAVSYRNKLTMKEAVANTSVTVPSFAQIDDLNSLICFAEQYQFPIIVKPHLASGSSGVQKLDNLTEINDWHDAHKSDLDAYMVEAFVDGIMYHVDGLVRNGKVEFVHPFEYINDCLSYRDDLYIANIPLDTDQPFFEALCQAAIAVIDALPKTEHFAFHSEFWVDSKGDITFCEIACRTGGGMISFLVEAAFGINLDKEWFFAECNSNEHALPLAKRVGAFGAVCIPPRNATLVTLPDILPESVIIQHFTGTLGNAYSGGEKSGLYLIGFIVKNNDRYALISDFQRCYSTVHQDKYWAMNERTLDLA